MRFVPVKSEEQPSVLMLHRVRELLIWQRTMLVNALRGHLAEFGIVTRQGSAGVGMLIALVEDGDHDVIRRSKTPSECRRSRRRQDPRVRECRVDAGSVPALIVELS